MITTLLILVGALIITNIITWLELSATRNAFDTFLGEVMGDMIEIIDKEKPKKATKKVAKKK